MIVKCWTNQQLIRFELKVRCPFFVFHVFLLGLWRKLLVLYGRVMTIEPVAHCRFVGRFRCPIFFSTGRDQRGRSWKLVRRVELLKTGRMRERLRLVFALFGKRNGPASRAHSLNCFVRSWLVVCVSRSA